MSGPLAASLADLAEIEQRLLDGDQFNAYQTGFGFWVVGIGPVSSFCPLTDSMQPQLANLLVDALRHAAGQQPALCRCFASDEEDDEA